MDGAAVTQFMSLTGTDAETARLWLAASAGAGGAVDVQAALSIYFEAQGSGGPAAGGEDGNGEEDPAVSAATTRGRAGGAPEAAEDARESYYAGGERSGQMIQGPADPAPPPPGGPSGRRSGRTPGPSRGSGEGEGADEDTLADSIFERARARGPLTDAETEAFSPNAAQAFTGAGYRLGKTPSETDGAGAGGAAAAGPPRPDVVGRRNVTRTLTFYRDGFTVDSGPLRRFDDPANVAFLRSVDAGFVPEEMETPEVGNVNIHLVDRKDVAWAESGTNGRKPPVASFSGAGHRLGDPASGSGGASSAPVEAVDPAAAGAEIVVDESAPVATIQIRLADGRRLRGRFNTTHTVQDLRAWVAGRSGLSTFELAMTFPRKVLSDGTVTLGEADLNGAVVVQTKR
ncbi:hypothetical protein MMPV_009233 [Pyropia vietnamensis]